MWRKPTEGKPSSESYNHPISASSPVENSRPASPSYAPPAPAPSRSSMESAPATLGSNSSKISSGLKINGEISGSADLYIDGEVQGKLRLGSARVTVGSNGRVQADIEAREIVVLGTVRGNLKASERIHLGESSRVHRSLQTARLGIDDGAKLRGKVDMTRRGESRNDPASERADAGALKPVAVQAGEE